MPTQENAAMNGSRPVAVFDFDGTLTRKDTLLPFLRFFVGTGPFLRKMVRSSAVLVGYRVGLIPNYQAKEQVLGRFLGGAEAGKVITAGGLFATHRLQDLMDPDMENVLSWHQAMGHQCIIVSASLDIYLRPWARSRGIDNLACTSLEVDPDGRMSGRILGRNVFGAEKVERLKRLAGKNSLRLDYAYGDSIGDREMLSLAEYPWYKGNFLKGRPPGWMEP